MADFDNKNQMFSCGQCGRTYRHHASLKRHSTNHTEKNHRCYVCGKMFYIYQGLKDHMVSNEPTRSCICYTCGKSFKHRQSLRKHIEQHNTIASTYDCSIYGKGFSRKDALKYHQETHEPKKTCQRCGRKLLHMENHLRICRDGRKKEHESQVCGRKFLKKRYLQENCRCVHSFEEFFSCTCGEKFRHRASLHGHAKFCAMASKK